MKKNRKRKIINRNIVMLVIVFVAVMAVLIHSYAEESNVSQEEIESSDTIHNVNYSYTSDNEKYYQAFEYQDEMLAADSGTLSPDLAKVTVGLATAAYSESEITACLSSMNYTLVDSKTFNYDGVRKATYEDNDFVAFSIGYKKVSLNGETYNAYVVPIRGTTGNDEWLSNFKLGAAGDSYHYGFKKAADGVLSTLRSKIKTKNNIFLITGHSRGAAVANIVAGELTIDKDLASPNHIFGYTYACPAVKIGADTTLDNVININNPGDAIPELPLADWGYQRYGKSLSLSTKKKFYDNMKVQYKNALGREYAGILNTDSYVATLKTIAGTREAYFQPENQMLFELAGWLLGPKTKEMDTLAKILAHYNVNGLIGKSISNILSDITVSGIQTAFDKENQNNKEILITIDGYLEDTVNMNESEFEDWRTSISNTSTFEKLQDEMNITIRTRSDLVQLRKEVKEEMDSFSYTQSNLETILSLFYTTKGELKNAIFDGHTPLTYVKWINSTYYGWHGWQNNDDVKNMEIENNIKRIDISCFQGCQNLNQVILPDTLEHVCGDAFEGCTGIKELTMPVDLDYVKTYSVSTYALDSSFGRCENIEKITYSKGKTGTMPDIESGSTSYYTAEYYAGKKLTTVEFQSGIEYIGAGSFDQASALKNIVLPCTVSAISSKTFCAINKSETVIYGTKDTYAEAYAKEQKIPFRGWNDPIITPEEPVAAPEEQVQLMGIAYTGVDEYVNISDWSVKECESKDTHIDENGLLTVGKDEPKGEIVVAACYGNYTETVKVRIVNPTYTVHFVGDITLDAKTDENCNVYCPREYEEKGYEYQYYLGKDTDSEQIEEKDWPLTVAQDTEIYVKKILKEPSIDKIKSTEKEMDFIYDGEKREISIFASHEIGEKGVLSYQWYYDDMQNGDFEEIHLATGASISVKDVKDSGVYKCRVTLCDGKDTTWVDSKVVCVNITQRLVPIPILQDSQKNLYYTGVEQKLLFEKLETDWVNITEAAATLPGNYVASVGLKDAENSIWADSTKEAKEYPWKIIGKETTPKPLESPTVTNAPTYEPGNTARPSGAPDENPSKTPEIKPGEVPTESPAATDTPTYEPGNTARPSGAPDENPERTPEIKASEVPTDVPEIKPTIAPDKITTGSQDTDLVFQPEDMTGDSREEALFLEKKVNVKKLQNKKKNKLYISWGKVELPQKAFYQVQISTKRNFKGAKNIYTTKSIYCYKGVKKGKKYYVRVRLGVTRDGKKIYGKWSNLKKKKIKN